MISCSETGTHKYFPATLRKFQSIVDVFQRIFWKTLTLLCIMLKNGQTYFKNLTV